MMTNQASPRVYIACLATYNAGILHVCWIDVPETAQELLEAVQSILAESEQEVAEEWAIHDSVGFGRLMLAEHESLQRVVDYAAFIRQLSEVGALLLDAYNGDLDQAKSIYENLYAGTYSDFTTFAEDVED